MIFLLFLSVVFAGCPFYRPFIDREELLPCFRLADMNHNNELSEMEIAIFLDVHNITIVTVTKIMNHCDIDHDGKLTMYDYEAPKSCLNILNLIDFICYECNKIN